MSAKKYPWKTWFNRRVFSIRRSTETKKGDYDCMPHAMAQQIRTNAGRMGKRVSLSIEEDVITITVEKARAKNRK